MPSGEHCAWSTTRCTDTGHTWCLEHYTVHRYGAYIVPGVLFNILKFLGSTLSKDGTSTKEIKIRIAVAMCAMSRLDNIWKSRHELTNQT